MTSILRYTVVPRGDMPGHMGGTVGGTNPEQKEFLDSHGVSINTRYKCRDVSEGRDASYCPKALSPAVRLRLPFDSGEPKSQDTVLCPLSLWLPERSYAKISLVSQ